MTHHMEIVKKLLGIVIVIIAMLALAFPVQTRYGADTHTKHLNESR